MVYDFSVGVIVGCAIVVASFTLTLIVLRIRSNRKREDGPGGNDLDRLDDFFGKKGK